MLLSFQFTIYAKYDQDTRIIEVKQGKFKEFISPAKGNIRDTYKSQNIKVRKRAKIRNRCNQAPHLA